MVRARVSRTRAGRKAWLSALLIGLALLATPCRAVQPDEILHDPALEARARELSRGLRCMVCQNQSIDDSEAPLARDLRILVRGRLQAGDSDRQVIDFLVARYGEFVLLRPRLAWHTAILWSAPVVLLVGGALVLLAFARRRVGATATAPAADLTPQEAARLSELTRES